MVELKVRLVLNCIKYGIQLILGDIDIMMVMTNIRKTMVWCFQRLLNMLSHRKNDIEKQIGLTLWSLVQLYATIRSYTDYLESCCLPAATTVQSRPALPNEVRS